MDFPELPFEPITIDGTEYKMCFDFGALAAAEEKLTEVGALKPTETLAFYPWRLNMRTLPLLFAASLMHYQPNITLAEARKLVTWVTYPGIAEAIVLARDASLPKVEEVDEDAGVAEDPSTAGS
jgi:hypothetical protein